MQFLILALFLIAMALVFVGEIMFVIAAFRVSVVWGLCVLFLGPAALIFLVMHWEEAKRAFGIQLLGILLGFATIFSTMGASTSPLASLTEAMVNSGMAEHQLEALQKKLAEETLDGQAMPSGSAVKQEAKSSKRFGKKDPESFIGATLQQTRDVLGRPKGEMNRGEEICLLYDGFTIFSSDGQIVSHVEKEDGNAASKPRKAHKTAPVLSRGPAVRMISNGGKRIDLKQILVPGKITVVDFYADWCGPCRRMGPQLEQIARSDQDVVLSKVNIVNWKTPVVKQFGIRSIPNVRVYNRNGVEVGSPSSGLSTIKQNIERAR